MTSRGIDLLGHQAVEVTRLTTGQTQRKTLQESLPSIILPILKQEPATTGEEAYSHRRGRGLVWPPEAQVPVLGDPANGAGRVLLAAVFEKLCRAETSWGHLDDTSFAWRPEGLASVAVEAAKLIAGEIESATQQEANIGLVVPDALGVAGQAALLSSFRSSRVLLVPRSIAVALSWAEANRGTLSTGPINAYAGYLTVVEAGLGRWSLSKVPVYRIELDGEPWLTAAHFPRLKKTNFNITGCSVLAASLGQDPKNMLRYRWQQPLFTGSAGSVLHLPSKQVRSSIDSLHVLDGTHDIMGSLTDLKIAQGQLEVMGEHGNSLGLIVTGALANVRLNFGYLRDEIGRRLGLKLLQINDDAAASGAALAARGLDSRWPTWLEMLEPLDLYYLGQNEVGDIEGAWKSILPAKLLKAGKEFRNDAPITGLKLQAGGKSVHITIRRKDDAGEPQYKKVETTTGKTSDTDVPLSINVVARPGQGFAMVQVDSKEPGAFSSHLDWLKMEPCQEPEPPPLAYVKRSVELVTSQALWLDCINPIQKLLQGILVCDEDSFPRQDLELAYHAIRKTIATVVPKSADYLARETALSIRLSPLDRHGKPPTRDGYILLNTVTNEILRQLHYHGHQTRTGMWIRRYSAYLRSTCPAVLIHEVLNHINKRPLECTDSDLLLAGLCFESEDDWAGFYKAFAKSIGITTRPNSWLKAIRDIVRFNENAMRRDYNTEGLYSLVVARLMAALENDQPVIAHNCFETLLYCLKRRRYAPNFVSIESPLYHASMGCIKKAQQTGICIGRRTLKEMTDRFERFLQHKGRLNDISDLMESVD